MFRKLALVLVATAALVVGGCSFFQKLPTNTTTQAAVAAAIDIAVGVAVQQGSNDQAVWKARAAQFESAAKAVQAVNAAGVSSLTTLQADLQPFIAKLGPADVLAANALVAALTPILQQLIGTNPTVGTVQTDVGLVVADVINACKVYTGS